MPTERPQQASTNMSHPEHHVAALPPPPPTQHLNYYPNHENIMSNQPQPQPSQSAPTFVHNVTMPPTSRRRSFGMTDSNIEQNLPPKRPHLEDIRSQSVSTSAYNTQNNDNSHQCRFVEPSVGHVPTTVPNSVAQLQQPNVSVASVVIAEDVINIYRLYEEHNHLRRRVEINEERLHELRATNTFLLQQNDQLRRQTQCSCTSTIVNPVTLTTASQQTATPVI